MQTLQLYCVADAFCAACFAGDNVVAAICFLHPEATSPGAGARAADRILGFTGWFGGTTACTSTPADH